MDRNGRVFLAVCISAAAIIVLVTLNLYAIDNLQYKFSRSHVDHLTGNPIESFRICNPTFFPVYFETLDIDLFHKGTKLGTFTMWGEPASIGAPTRLVDPTLPMSVTTVYSQRNITDPDFSRYLSSGYGRTSVMQETFNERHLSAVGNIGAPIFGIIPFSIPQTFTADAFAKMMRQQAFTADAFTDAMVLDDASIEKICSFLPRLILHQGSLP